MHRAPSRPTISTTLSGSTFVGFRSRLHWCSKSPALARAFDQHRTESSSIRRRALAERQGLLASVERRPVPPDQACRVLGVRLRARASPTMPSFSAITAGSERGRPKRIPFCFAAATPALTGSLMSSGSYSARAASTSSFLIPGRSHRGPAPRGDVGEDTAFFHSDRDERIELQLRTCHRSPNHSWLSISS